VENLMAEREIEAISSSSRAGWNVDGNSKWRFMRKFGEWVNVDLHVDKKYLCGKG
jgi:hypothetical protein